MSHNPDRVDGKCVTCGTGQLKFEDYGPGCLCSLLADAEYKTEERIIKLLEEQKISDEAAELAWQERDWKRVEEQQMNDEILDEVIALIKGENK